MFSKACEYGIRAMIYIASESQKGNRASLKAIAKAIDSPMAFTSKILQTLVKDGLIVSIKGTAGGYELINESNAQVTLLDLVTSIDGDDVYRKCGLGLKICNEAKPCPVHFQFKSIRNDLTDMLASTTVIDLANELKFGMTFLKV